MTAPSPVGTPLVTSTGPAGQDWPAKYHPAQSLPEGLAGLPRPWVFTNGVFDLLHRGHVQGLQAARALGASLIVGVNSDASAQSLGKGPGRPVHTAADRVWVLAALEAVSAVTVFEETTPLAILACLRPEFYVKGGDYDVARLPEAALVAQWGGYALAVPFMPGHSSTDILRRLSTAPQRG
jgi:rfaE bifunctional protein nucleotidyltransferase chain/domain